MEEKNELNNIVLDNEQEEKIQNSKKMLLIGAAATVLFLIAIIIVYSLNQSNEESSPTQQTEQGLVPTDTANKAMEVQKEDVTPKFEQVPIKDETPPTEKPTEDKFEKIVKEIKAKQQNAESAEPANLPPPPADEKSEAIKEVLSQTTAATKKESAPTTTPTAPAKEEKEESAKASVTDVPKGYYVQVGSFAKFTPNKKFLTTIKENGYDYHILKTKTGDRDIQKVLIGPFGSKADAEKATKKIREDINKDAFLKKL